MTKEEIFQKYNIPPDVLDEYHKWNLCGEVKKVMGTWQYDDSDLEKLSTIMTLHKIGFEKPDVEKYMRLLETGCTTEKERLEMLGKKRDESLEEIHFKEKQISCLDYLRQKIRNDEKIT
jgi:DNA-binding transcriptional MerR regulator